MYPKKASGFSLMELLIVLLITSGFVVIAYPSYTHLLMKAHRSDAQLTLAQEQIILEQCFAQNKAYNKDCDALANAPHTSPRGYYLIHIQHRGRTTYTLRATAIGRQSQDHHCLQFIVNQINKKTATDASGANQPDCWNKA